MRRIVKRLLAIVVLVIALAMIAGRCEGATDIIDATVRVLGPDGAPAGTAVVVGNDGRSLLLATCGHVVRQGKQGNGPPHQAMAVECWRDGFRSTAQPARVTAAGLPGDLDAGLLGVSVAVFGGSPPPQVPLAPSGFQLQPGQTIISVGCSMGSWPTVFRGHVVQMSPEEQAEVNPGSFAFTPGPAQGRSGSGVFALYQGRPVLVGILYGQSKTLPRGYATSIDTIRQRWGVVAKTSIVPVQCENGQCPGVIPKVYRGIFGGNQPQPQPPPLPAPSNPFPGLPAWGAGPMVDAEARARIGSLEQEVASLRNGQARIDGIDRDVAGLAEDVDAKVDSEELQGKLAEVVEDVGGIRGVIDKVQAGEIEGIRAVVKAVLFSYGWWGVGIAGIFGYFIWDLYRKVKTGDPLLIEKLRDRIHDRAAPVREAVRERLDGLDNPAVNRLLARLDSIEARLHPPTNTGS